MNYKFLSKNGPTLAFGLFVVCVVISLIPIISGLSDFSAIPTENQAASEEGNIFMPGIYISVALLAIGTIIAIVLSVLNVAINPKASMKALISFGILLVLFGILYSVADPTGSGSLAETIQRFEIGEGISKLIGGGITLTVIMLLGSAVITVVMELLGFFKNQ